MKPQRIEILGVPVDCVDMPAALRRLDDILVEGGRAAVIAVNPEKVVRAHRDERLLATLAGAGLLIPDGVGIVLAARILGLGPISRVAGADLMPELCGHAARSGRKVFLYGARPEVNRRLAGILPARYPGLRLVGAAHGFLKKDEMPTLVDQINASGADILFVALGSPRQERWIEEYLPLLKVKICQGVGGTFDILAGDVRRAPLVFRRLSIEWLYRLLAQPSRLFRQTALPIFAWAVVKKRFGSREIL